MGSLVGGLAIIENAYHQTAKLAAVAVDSANPLPFFEREVALHSEAKALMPSLPIPLERWPAPVTLDPARPDALYCLRDCCLRCVHCADADAVLSYCHITILLSLIIRRVLLSRVHEQIRRPVLP